MTSFPYSIRSINPAKDSRRIAQLIRIGFRPWLDEGNLRYLGNLEKAGAVAEEHEIWFSLTGFPYDLKGVVCTDQNGRIIGVINTYYFYLQNKKCCLVCNVTTDPAYRGQRVASHMLREIIRQKRSEHIHGIFLQARMENPVVIDFYRREGFQVTDYRETWIHPVLKRDNPSQIGDLTLEKVPSGDIPEFERAMLDRYPLTVRWNLEYRADLFRDGIADSIGRLFPGVHRNFSGIVRDDGRVIAWTAWQSLKDQTDQLWFVPGRDISAENLTNALAFVVTRWQEQKPVRLDIPAGKDGAACFAAGFRMLHRLAWMWHPL